MNDRWLLGIVVVVFTGLFLWQAYKGEAWGKRGRVISREDDAFGYYIAMAINLALLCLSWFMVLWYLK